MVSGVKCCMQQTSIAPEVKAALARCFAAHKALRSYSAEVSVLVRGVPKEKSAQLRLAFARPGRARFECSGPRAIEGSKLLVATDGYIYEAFRSGTNKTTRVPIEADALTVACENTEMLPLPIFSQLMVSAQGLGEAIAPYQTITQEPGKLMFRGVGQANLTLIFDPRDLLLREARVTQGTSVEFREVYQNVRVNPRLPASLWRFNPASVKDTPVKEKSIL